MSNMYALMIARHKLFPQVGKLVATVVMHGEGGDHDVPMLMLVLLPLVMLMSSIAMLNYCCLLSIRSMGCERSKAS